MRFLENILIGLQEFLKGGAQGVARAQLIRFHHTPMPYHAQFSFFYLK
jgi:hypothetical protein